MDTATPGLTVSDAAARVGLTAHTLRWYEQEGPVRRDAAGRRRYHADDMARLSLLIKLRSTGMPVRDMRRYAALVAGGDETLPQRLDLLRTHRARVVARINELSLDLATVDYKIDLYQGLLDCPA